MKTRVDMTKRAIFQKCPLLLVILSYKFLSLLVFSFHFLSFLFFLIFTSSKQSLSLQSLKQLIIIIVIIFMIYDYMHVFFVIIKKIRAYTLWTHPS